MFKCHNARATVRSNYFRIARVYVDPVIVRFAHRPKFGNVVDKPKWHRLVPVGINDVYPRKDKPLKTRACRRRNANGRGRQRVRSRRNYYIFCFRVVGRARILHSPHNKLKKGAFPSATPLRAQFSTASSPVPANGAHFLFPTDDRAVLRGPCVRISWNSNENRPRDCRPVK